MIIGRAACGSADEKSSQRGAAQRTSLRFSDNDHRNLMFNTITAEKRAAHHPWESAGHSGQL